MRKSQSGNEGKKRLATMVALVAFGASVGLTAQVNAGSTYDAKKAATKVDTKALKTQKQVDASKIQNIDTRKIEKVDTRKLDTKQMNKMNKQLDPGSGSGRPPPP